MYVNNFLEAESPEEAQAENPDSLAVQSVFAENTILTQLLSAIPQRLQTSHESGAQESSAVVTRIAAAALWGGLSLDIMPYDAVFSSIDLAISNITPQAAKTNNPLANFSTDEIVVGTSAVVTTSLSVGYVVWILRGGSLLTAFMSATPAWSAFDPLPILKSFASAEETDDESLLSIVSRKVSVRRGK